ncbi:MAG: DUF1810 domain-containing protein [Burkholderiales bacterium]|nr:DUF1810 domain-containing protein [Burkholderiales bacterium]
MPDPHGLQRFVDAQAPLIDDVLAELAAGRKRSHWMWFVFPQLRGLGSSAMADHYGLGSLAEARAYAQHPLLGARLRRSVELLLAVPGADAEAILGSVDALKLHSCLTLFALAAPGEPLYGRALARFFAGAQDAGTLRLLLL